MNIQDYIENDRYLYDEFSKVVASILKSALDEYPKTLGVQQIQHRSKSVKSLSKKLKDRGIYHSDNIENEIKDLAGCRVIFYQNDDLSTFLSSGIVADNFEVDWDNSKFHHPSSDAKTANEYYMANHFMISLKTERLALPDFSKFAGMRCEIQVQTLLNHAWAETVHDIIYKRSETGEFGVRLMASIDDRLKNIMTEYLRPAGYEFQKVKRDYNKLIKGKEIIDSDIRASIDTAENNNILYELLERYRDYVLPNYSDYGQYADEIYEIILSSILKSKDLDIVDIETPYGSFGGKSYKDILSISLEILSCIRYLDIERTQSLFIHISSMLANRSEEEAFIDHVERFAGYNYEVLTRNGLYVQESLIRNLSKMKYEELVLLSRYVVPVCKAILQPSFEKTEWTHDQVTIGAINLSGDETLDIVRQGAIEILKRLYITKDESIRAGIRDCFDVATRTPYMGNYSDELLNIILANSDEVVKIYIDDLPRQNYQEIQDCEVNIHFLYTRSVQVASDKGKPKHSKDIANKLMSTIDEFRIRANSNDEYKKFKVLVGFNSVLNDDWNSEQWDYEQEDQFRKHKITEFVASIDEKNYADWVKIIAICAKADSSDLAQFEYFHIFLRLLASEKPDLTLRFLNEHEAGIEKFLVSILLGIADSGRLDVVDSVISDYLKSGKKLWECARLFVLYPNANRARLTELFEIAKKQDDVDTMIQVLSAVIIKTPVDKNEISTLFIPIISELTSRGESNWVHQVWFRRESTKALELLDIDQSKNLLANLTRLRDIDYHAEQVLLPIAKNYPHEVIQFFGERLRIESQEEHENSYDAIPYEFHELVEPLSVIPEDLVDIVLSWYNFDSTLFQYRGGDLIAKIFPEFNNLLKAKLIDLIRSRGEEIVDFVTSILKNYKGEIFLHDVCKEIIANIPEESEYLTDVQIILEESGVLHGEFGFVELCERKKAEILPWLEDKNSKVKSFAGAYVRSLDRQRAAEQRRVEEEIEMRKHEYGE